jgi:hypothetical protein
MYVDRRSEVLPQAASCDVLATRGQLLTLESMPNRFRNWSYRNLTDFLREKGFSLFKEIGGSHQQWIKRSVDGKPDKILEIYFRHNAYPMKTIQTTARKSGIPEDEWLKWSGS